VVFEPGHYSQGGRTSSQVIWGLGATYAVHLRLIGKRVVEFISVLNFLLGAAAEALRANTDRKSTFSLQRGQFDPKFQIQGVAPTNNSSSCKTRLNDLSHGMKIWTVSSVFHNARV